MSGLASAMMDAFEEGYALPGKLRARAAAKEQFGASAEDPGLFKALGQEERAQNTDRRADNTDRRADDAAARDERGVVIRESAETRAQETHQTDQAADDTTKRTNAVLGVVQGLTAARDRGEDIGAAFDAQIDLLRQLGVEENDIPEMRQAVVDNPAVLDDYLATINGTSGAAPGKKTDKQKALEIMDNPQATDAQTAWAKSIMARTGSSSKSGGADGDEDEGALANSGWDILRRIDLLEDEEMEKAGRAVFGVMSPSKLLSGGGGNTFDPISGTPAADYLANFVGLESDIRSAAFETLKGGGQITEKESEFAANAISNLQRSVSWEEYKRELVRLREYLERLQGVQVRRAGGEDVPDITGDEESSPDKVQVYPGFVDEYGNTFKGGDPSDEASWELAE